MNEDPGKFYPPRVPENDVPPILEYRGPQLRSAIGIGRARSIAMGVAAVWASGILAFIASITIQSDVGGVVLLLASAGLICFAIWHAVQRKHAGFFLGLFLGVLTVIGVAALTVAVICGAFRK